MRRRTTWATVTIAGILFTGMSPAHAAPDYADVLASTIESDVPPAHRIDPWAVNEDEAEPRPMDGWARPDVISPARLAVLRLERIREEEKQTLRFTSEPVSAPMVNSHSGLTERAIQELICSYAWDCATALRVSGCEAGYSPTAGTPGSYYGLFQVDYETSSDPETQLRNAWAKYVSAGHTWAPWGWPHGDFGCAFG